MIDLKLNNVTDTVIIGEKQYLLCPKSDLIALLNEQAEVKKERAIIKNTVIKLLSLLGFIDKNGKFKENLAQSKVYFILSLTQRLPKLFDMFSNETGEGAQMLTDLKPLLTKYAND